MADVKTEIYIKGLGEIVYCNDSAFDKASSAVLKNSDGLITFRDLAYARLVNADYSGSWKNSYLCTTGSYVQEGSLFVPDSDNRRIWLSDSLVLKNPSLAVKAHKNGNEYVFSDLKIGEFVSGLKEGTDYVVVKNTSVPTEGFDDYAETRFAFKDQAKDYGLFLKKAGISSVNLWMYNNTDSHIDSQSGPFANQLWLRRLDDSSSILGSNRILDSSNMVRGVRRESSAEGVKDVSSNLVSLDDAMTNLSKYILEKDRDDFRNDLKNIYYKR